MQLAWLAPDAAPDAFPPVAAALRDPPGLLCAGGDLSPARLLLAYQRAIFPWYSAGDPILWWSPDPRTAIFPDELHRSRSLRRTLGAGRLRCSADRAFEAVVAGCAGPRRGADGTWITPAMGEAYRALHALGHAHSIECWADGKLVGGLYGVMVGSAFCGESMFSRAPDASKVALVALASHLRAGGGTLIDCQLPSPHLARLGARPVHRAELLEQLARPAPALAVARWELAGPAP